MIVTDDYSTHAGLALARRALVRQFAVAHTGAGTQAALRDAAKTANDSAALCAMRCIADACSDAQNVVGRGKNTFFTIVDELDAMVVNGTPFTIVTLAAGVQQLLQVQMSTVQRLTGMSRAQLDALTLIPVDLCAHPPEFSAQLANGASASNIDWRTANATVLALGSFVRRHAAARVWFLHSHSVARNAARRQSRRAQAGSRSRRVCDDSRCAAQHLLTAVACVGAARDAARWYRRRQQWSANALDGVWQCTGVRWRRGGAEHDLEQQVEFVCGWRQAGADNNARSTGRSSASIVSALHANGTRECVVLPRAPGTTASAHR